MRPATCRRAAAIALAAAIAVATAVVRADAAISVTFQVSDPEIGAHFGTPAAQQRLTEAVVAQLNRDPELRFWMFAAGSTLPQLQVRVTKRTKTWQYEVALRAGTGPALKTWSVPWITEADVERVGGFPPVTQLTTQIIDGFESRFLAAKGPELLELLHSVPLGAAAHVDPTREVGILQLEWSRYQDLALSDFRILYRTATGSLMLIAKGSGNRMAYPSPPPAEGVAVRLLACEVDGQRATVSQQAAAIRGGQPVAVFLTRFDPLGAALSAAGGGLPPPSIAPRD